MLSVAVREAAPYKAVLTHGFVVDQDKKKLSKSAAEKAGKPIDAKHFYSNYGADILRLWVSSVDWQNEVPFGEDIFKQTTEPYRRFRNILRILLGNLSDFDPGKDVVADDDLPLVDRWILERLHEVVTDCRAAYADYEFRKVFNTLNQFCAVDLSALYVDITKDRMYCDAPDSLRRRATQTAMHRVFEALVRLLAPILSYTADEAWEHAGHEDSIHLETFPEPDPAFSEKVASGKVEQLSKLRDLAQVAIDASVKAGDFKKREQAAVTFHLKKDDYDRDLATSEDALEFLMVSEIRVGRPRKKEPASVAMTDHPECPRCRRSLPLVEGEGLCERCVEAMSSLQPA